MQAPVQGPHNARKLLSAIYPWNSLLLGNYFGLGGFFDFSVDCFPL